MTRETRILPASRFTLGSDRMKEGINVQNQRPDPAPSPYDKEPAMMESPSFSLLEREMF
jgi:hypothetical protein